ncbi:GIY-YIG nuclease family protein [Ligilactobacillus sp. Marseille-Q7487]|jgi:putative endonuclease|uniref:GIY-YIG nuclease family protein n=1 Tax=Ligilactobacillus sp. Marseille-Q7487 TaxID=3022128 RepID=UPI0015B5F12E|nr:GIY-YIG nuclease family protein [Ligilactobacillus sp. Marseille-Q7487]
METKKYYVYVLCCSDQTLYTGFTTDVTKRLAVHNAGKGAKYTKTRRPLHLLYFEEFVDKSQALKAEYAFKRLTRIQKVAYLRDKGVKLPLKK